MHDGAVVHDHATARISGLGQAEGRSFDMRPQFLQQRAAFRLAQAGDDAVRPVWNVELGFAVGRMTAHQRTLQPFLALRQRQHHAQSGRIDATLQRIMDRREARDAQLQ